MKGLWSRRWPVQDGGRGQVQPTVQAADRPCRCVDPQLRRAIADDAPALAQLLAVAFAPHRASYTPAAYAATTPDAAALRTRLAEGPAWLVEEEGRAVGTVSAVARGDDLHVRSMAVLPEAAGQGLGARLLAEAESFARAAGHARLTLSSTPFLVAALRLYARAGFVATGEGELHGTPLVHMAKPLR